MKMTSRKLAASTGVLCMLWFASLCSAQNTDDSTAVWTTAISDMVTWGEARTDLLSRELKDGQLILTWRKVTPSNSIYLTNPARPVPPTIEVWRDVYGVEDMEIVLLRTEHAKVTPETETTDVTPEKHEWPTQ